MARKKASFGRRQRHSKGRACDADWAREVLIDEITNWGEDDPFAVKTPKLVFKTLLKDAGVGKRMMRERTRQEIAHELSEQVLNANKTQACTYLRERESAISRDFYGYKKK